MPSFVFTRGRRRRPHIEQALLGGPVGDLQLPTGARQRRARPRVLRRWHTTVRHKQGHTRTRRWRTRNTATVCNHCATAARTHSSSTEAGSSFLAAILKSAAQLRVRHAAPQAHSGNARTTGEAAGHRHAIGIHCLRQPYRRHSCCRVSDTQRSASMRAPSSDDTMSSAIASPCGII